MYAPVLSRHGIGCNGGCLIAAPFLPAYMNVKYPENSFSAWVPISNLIDWYRESVGRKQKYAQDILMCNQKQSATLSLSIFEGGHEQIVEQVIPLIPIARKYRLTTCRLPQALRYDRDSSQAQASQPRGTALLTCRSFNLTSYWRIITCCPEMRERSSLRCYYQLNRTQGGSHDNIHYRARKA